ncbi:tyrosine-type recombinase/integrase [Bacillus cereus]|uniref:tyrosine-type recombinase/integrase n=1 Tax=Bacillus cereus TaxID=1396 RepID=UPI001D0EC8C7|nr:tyrosine-type recombinase/integrase [Bacillus cereus]MCC2382010.1 tyrosine-type recombinase/integrase [Bacillus cereus]
MIHKFVDEALKGKSITTVKTYTHALKQFEQWLNGAGTDLESFARSDVQQYIDYMVSHKKSASTINKVFNALKKYCKWSNKTEAIADISVVKQKDLKRIAPKSLDRNERNQLIREVDRAGNKRDLAIVLLLLNTGLRVSELTNIDINDIDINDIALIERKGTVKVIIGKVNKERTVPLNAETRKALNKYLEERSGNNPALFLSNRGERISVRSVQHLINKHGFNVHQLRHTFITDLVRAGHDISVIQSLTGHSSAEMILRYSAPSEEDRTNAVEKLYKNY